MGLLDFFRSSPAMDARRRRSRQEAAIRGMVVRAYDMGRTDRLFSSWTTGSTSSDAELKQNLRGMRARARDLSQNVDYARRFIKLMAQNVIGPNGIRLQMRIVDPATGLIDRAANQLVESAWEDWGRVGSCTVDGRHSWLDVERIVLESVVRDGEVLVRKVPNLPRFNRYGLALQLLESDLLDEELNEEKSDRRWIRLGIEVDRWDRPRVFHLFREHPGDRGRRAGGENRERVQVAAEEIVHAFIAERPTQRRGVPWMHSAATRMQMLGGYEEAELVAARAGASKMGFLISPDGDAYQGDGTDETGTVVEDVTPGEFRTLGPGWDVKEWDPDHPNSSFEAFEKAVKRGMASGLGVSYHQLANDLESVNFSSARVAELADRDFYRSVQRWFIDHVSRPVFEAWLDAAIASQALGLPASRRERILAGATWQPRGWAWVDPQKEADGNARAYMLGVKSLSEIAADAGRDLEDVFRQMKADAELATEFGVTINAAGEASADEGEDEDE